MTNKEHHAAICQKLTALYDRKNHDYGDSFHIGWEKYGILMLLIRLWDKLSRLDALTLGKEPAQVAEESMRDTLLDLANYAIMGLMELDHKQESKTMTPSEYQTAAMRTCNISVDSPRDTLMHVVLGLASEAEEIAEVMKTNIAKLKARYPNGFDAEHSLHRKPGDV